MYQYSIADNFLLTDGYNILKVYHNEWEAAKDLKISIDAFRFHLWEKKPLESGELVEFDFDYKICGQCRKVKNSKKEFYKRRKATESKERPYYSESICKSCKKEGYQAKKGRVTKWMNTMI